MEVLGKAMGGEGKYVTTVGSLTSKSQNEWIDGGVEYQKKNFPKMQEVTKRLEAWGTEPVRAIYVRLGAERAYGVPLAKGC